MPHPTRALAAAIAALFLFSAVPSAEAAKKKASRPAAAQTRQCLATIEQSLERAGFTLNDVVRTRMFVTDISRWEEVGRAHGEVFGEIRPASAMLVVKELLDPRWRVEIEADAVLTS